MVEIEVRGRSSCLIVKKCENGFIPCCFDCDRVENCTSVCEYHGKLSGDPFKCPFYEDREQTIYEA